MLSTTAEFSLQVAALLSELGIAADLPAARGLRLWPAPTEMVVVGATPSGREFLLTPAAAQAWQSMQNAAAGDGVALHLVSAYRSIEHQAAIIRAKLQAGVSLPEVLRVLAPPGYSEHHSGTAVDIGSPDCKPLDAHFDAMPAFAWLSANAERFGFFLSFPKDNQFGYIYEPWHWRFCDGAA
jgi:zinc D-Ala-D-Ala carboxypeptidase